MQVFLSWSGAQSKIVAQGLRRWLPKVSRELEPWMSEEDARAGLGWREELREAMRTTHAAVFCLTPENTDSKWVMYEVGAVSECPIVCPLLLGLRPHQLPAPLDHLQAVTATKTGSRRLLTSLNEGLGDNGLSSAELRRRFEERWPQLDNVIRRARARPEAQSRRKQKETARDLGDTVNTMFLFLGRFASGVRERRKKRQALERALDATDATLEYLGKLEGQEGWANPALARKWRSVGQAILSVESDESLKHLALRCFKKADYWRSPERWERLLSSGEVDDSAIALERLSYEIRKALADNTQSNR